MSEKEVKIEQGTSDETGKDEQKPSAKKVVKKPKVVKATADEQQPSAEVKKEKKATAIEEMMAAIKNMTVLELAELVKALEAEFGVSAAAPVAVAAAAPTEAAASVAEEKTEFNVILKDIGANKINVIRAVRELTPLGLKEAKDLVESAPTAVREGISKDEATTVKQKLEAAGATVEVT